MDDFEFNKKFVNERKKKKKNNKKQEEENQGFDQQSGDEIYKMRSKTSVGSESFKKLTQR